MVWYIVFGVAAVAIAPSLYGYIQYRRMEWPSSLSYYAFRRNTMRFMRRHGWTINLQTWVPFDMWADRKGTRLAIVLLPPGMALTASKMKDICAAPPEASQGRGIVIVSYAKGPTHLVDEAARGKVRLVWYKELATL